MRYMTKILKKTDQDVTEKLFVQNLDKREKPLTVSNRKYNV